MSSPDDKAPDPRKDPPKGSRTELLEIARSLKSYLQDDLEKGRSSRFYLKDMPKKIVKPEPRKAAAAKPEPSRTSSPEAFTKPLKKVSLQASTETLEDIRRDLNECRRCILHAGRSTIVFGEGNPKAKLLFIGEGPGRDEDLQGRPFVGRAGQLLNKIIAAMGYKREEVYIANVVKCRPPNNREPLPDEVAACTPFLERQIAAIGPKVICALGASAARHLLQTDVPISVMRGRFHDHKGIQVMVTYHPAYLLRNPAAKKQTWEDIQKVMAVL
jgi:uracil-DNA glycosylase